MKRASGPLRQALFGLAVLAWPVAGSHDALAAGRTCVRCDVPADAQPVDTSSPDRVIGNGTPESCTSAEVVAKIALGGIIAFDCGPDPVTIALDETARIYNNTGPQIVIDGGGLVTLDGGSDRRILYMNTCDPDLVWTTDHCQNQDHPQLTLQNLTFAHGNASGATPDGGGAVFARGGRIKVINSRFYGNACDATGPDVGGGALRVLSQFDGLPVWVVGSTFGGSPARGNRCSNGGALSGINVSYSVINSDLGYNEATGVGANPPRAGTPGGGNGGAIYGDGNTYTLSICGSVLYHDHANEGGGGVFFVSNDLSGTLIIDRTTIWSSPSDGFHTDPWSWLFYLGLGPPQITDSTFETPAPDLFCDGFEASNVFAWELVLP